MQLCSFLPRTHRYNCTMEQLSGYLACMVQEGKLAIDGGLYNETITAAATATVATSTTTTIRKSRSKTPQQPRKGRAAQPVA